MISVTLLIGIMNFDDEYDIPKNVEDKYLYSVATMAKEILKNKCIVKDIMQKHILAYNKSSNSRCSSKSLKVMNQNHKPIFAAIKSSEVKESPRCSSASTKKDARTPGILDTQFHTPLKANQINSNTERKRLPFDIDEIERTSPGQAFTEDTKGQEYLNSSESSLEHDEGVKNFENHQEILNCYGIPRSASFHPSHDQPTANMPLKTPEEQNETLENLIGEIEWTPWYLECRPSIYRKEIVPKVFDSPDKFIKERFNLEGKPETITSIAFCDYNAFQETSADNQQMVVVSPKKENSTPPNYIIDAGKSARCLPSSPSTFTSEKEDKISYKHEQESFNPNDKPKSVTSSPVTPLKTLCISPKTPEKTRTSTVKAKNKARKSITPNAVRRVSVKADTNNKENVSPIEDIKISNTSTIKKRKFVDNSEKAIMSTGLFTADQEFTVPSKISKINDELNSSNGNASISSVVSVINGNDSVCSTDESFINTSNSFHSADDSAIYDNNYINRSDDDIVEKGIAQSGDKSTPAVPINNCDKLYISPTKIPERPTCQTSITPDCISFRTSEHNQSKIPAEIKFDLRNLKYDEKEISAPERENLESLQNIMEDLNPSVKRSDVGAFRKSMMNESGSDNTTILGKRPLQDSQLNTSPRIDSLISKEPYAKQNNSYYLEVKKFDNMLKQTKTRFSMYLRIFEEDKDDLNFIRGYMELITVAIRKIPPDGNKEELMKSVDDTMHKCIKIIYKATLWVTDTNRDLMVWKDCIEKIHEIQKNVNLFCKESKKVMTSKVFQILEAIYKMVNKKADGMILLKEIKRPTIIQFGYEICNLTQLFIQNMIMLGLLKHSTR